MHDICIMACLDRHHAGICCMFVTKESHSFAESLYHYHLVTKMRRFVQSYMFVLAKYSVPVAYAARDQRRLNCQKCVNPDIQEVPAVMRPYTASPILLLYEHCVLLAAGVPAFLANVPVLGSALRGVVIRSAQRMIQDIESILRRVNDSTDIHEVLRRAAQKGHAEEADKKAQAQQKRQHAQAAAEQKKSGRGGRFL